MFNVDLMTIHNYNFLKNTYNNNNIKHFIIIKKNNNFYIEDNKGRHLIGNNKINYNGVIIKIKRIIPKK